MSRPKIGVRQPQWTGSANAERLRKMLNPHAPPFSVQLEGLESGHERIAQANWRGVVDSIDHGGDPRGIFTIGGADALGTSVHARHGSRRGRRNLRTGLLATGETDRSGLVVLLIAAVLTAIPALRRLAGRRDRARPPPAGVRC